MATHILEKYSPHVDVLDAQGAMFLQGSARLVLTEHGRLELHMEERPAGPVSPIPPLPAEPLRVSGTTSDGAALTSGSGYVLSTDWAPKGTERIALTLGDCLLR